MLSMSYCGSARRLTEGCSSKTQLYWTRTSNSQHPSICSFHLPQPPNQLHRHTHPDGPTPIRGSDREFLEEQISEETRDMRNNPDPMLHRSHIHIDQLGTFLVALIRCSIKQSRSTRLRDTMFSPDPTFRPSCPQHFTLNSGLRLPPVKSGMDLTGLMALTIHIGQQPFEIVDFSHGPQPRDSLWSMLSTHTASNNMADFRQRRTTLICHPFHPTYWALLSSLSSHQPQNGTLYRTRTRVPTTRFLNNIRLQIIRCPTPQQWPGQHWLLLCLVQDQSDLPSETGHSPGQTRSIQILSKPFDGRPKTNAQTEALARKRDTPSSLPSSQSHLDDLDPIFTMDQWTKYRTKINQISSSTMVSTIPFRTRPAGPRRRYSGLSKHKEATNNNYQRHWDRQHFLAINIHQETGCPKFASLAMPRWTWCNDRLPTSPQCLR